MFRKTYTALWLLLAAAFAVVSLIAFSDDLTIGGKTLKKAPLSDLLTDKTDIAEQEAMLPDTVPVLEEKVLVDSLPQSIFIFGDSMTFNLALRLAQYARQNGHTINSVNWDSSNTKIWAEHDTLSYYINKFRPTQIFISLGSNELYISRPETRLPYIRKILEVIDTIPYVLSLIHI